MLRGPFRGAARRLLLFEIGGIDAPFSLSLPLRAASLRALAEPVPVQFTVLEEKFIGRTVHEGLLTELSPFEARLSSVFAPAVLSNLKITVATSPQGNPAGEIYGKVVEVAEGGPGLARVRFTSTTPELKAWVTAWARA